MTETYLDFDNFDNIGGRWDIKLPPAFDVEAVLFVMSYLFPKAWFGKMKEIENEGHMIGEYHASSMQTFDAMKYRFLFPVYESSELSGETIYFKYWSPLEHIYCDFDELGFLELDVLYNLLANGVWSYN